MIVDTQLVAKVKEYFDLNIYETKVWLALLSKGVVSAGETAELSGVPRSRTYDVLESLAKRGFAIVKVGKPVRYIAVEPKTVIEKMKSNVLHQAEDKVKLLSALKDRPEFDEIVALHKTGISPIKSEDISGFIRGRPNVLVRLKELISDAEKEIAIYTSIDDFEDKARVLIPTIQEAEKKGLKLKMALSGDEDRIKKIENKYKFKIKRFSNNSRFFIADKEEALFMINAHNSNEEIGIWLNAPFFTEAMHGIFETHLRG